MRTNGDYSIVIPVIFILGIFYPRYFLIVLDVRRIVDLIDMGLWVTIDTRVKQQSYCKELVQEEQWHDNHQDGSSHTMNRPT